MPIANVSSESLFFLAFDHRSSFHRLVDAVEGSRSDRAERIAACKRLVYDGYLHSAEAMDPELRAHTAVIIDEESGADLATDAIARGVYTVMPSERTEQRYFAFEYGEQWREHIQAFAHHGVKGLVRWNPTEPEVNAAQVSSLAELSAWLRAHGRDMLLELLVQPTDAQLAECGGDYETFDTAMRPELTCTAIRQLYAADICPDIWKIEGIADRTDCRSVGQAALDRPDGRPSACVVLGRSAPEAQVQAWLGATVGVAGYRGFALGRTLFNQPLTDWLRGSLPRDVAVKQIADGYRRFIDFYLNQAGEHDTVGDSAVGGRTSR